MMAAMRVPARRRLLVSLAAMSLVVVACTSSTGDDAGDDGPDAGATPGGVAPSASDPDEQPPELDLAVDGDQLTVSVDGDPVLALAPPAPPDSPEGAAGVGPVAWRTVPYEVRSKQGELYLGHELLSTPPASEVPFTSAGAPEVLEDDDGGLTVAYPAAGPERSTAEVRAEPVDGGVVRIAVTAPPDATELAVSFVCGPEQRFYGLGAQVWATQHRGETVPIWVVEQGLGKVTPETPEPVPSVLGEPYDSYVPMPFLWSDGGSGPVPHGVSLDTDRYSTFELCTEEHPEVWRVRTWDRELAWYVYAGSDPLDVIERYTSVVGRPERLPPDWFFAPMNDAVRGQDNVRRVAELIRANDIPSSVIWTEDWLGIGSQATGFRLSHDWDVSTTEYPDLAALTAGLHDLGFRFLGYFSPFIVSPESTPGGPSVDQGGDPVELVAHNAEKWAEAVEGRFFITTPGGAPYLMFTPPFALPGGTALDVTNPEAVAWYQGYVRRAEALGLDGAMVDFGEWVPFDAQFADGRTGAELHNPYPVIWQGINREVWDELRPDGDYLFYSRSGYTGSQTTAPAIWGGDQNTTFDRLDGLGSVITLGVNLGMSGVSFYGHDIAGYSAFAIPGVANTPTTKELFLRWAAIGAYTPMMRTHHGSRYGENWSFEGAPNPDDPSDPVDDPETLRIWKRLAETHIALFPYAQAYAARSVATGAPIMRHPILLHPDDPNLQQGLPEGEEWEAFAAVGRPADELFQYYFGDELLVAPVVDEGVDSRPVYLPEGLWVDVRTGARHSGPTTVTASAAPGDVPVYAPAGAIVPQLPPGVETLAPSTDPDVVDLGDVAGRRAVDVYLGADGGFVLVDGTRFELSSAPLQGPVDLDGVRVEVDGEEADVGVSGSVLTIDVDVEAEAELALTLDDRRAAVLTIATPEPVVYTVRLVA